MQRSILISAGVLVSVYLLYQFRQIVFATLIGVGFGVLLAPTINTLQEKARIPRGLSALVVVLLVLGGITGVSYGLFTLLSDQVALLVERTPDIVRTLRQQTERLFENQPWIKEQVEKLNLGGATSTAFSTLFQGVQMSITVLAGALVILMLSVYVSINSRTYMQGFLTLFPAHRRGQIREICSSSASVLRRWFKSQLIVISITGAITSVALWILGIDYWLLLGVLTAALGFIPYIGALLTGLAAVLVTLGSQPDKVWWVLLVYLGIQQIEGNISIPLVMKGGVQLPEAHLIVFMLMMGTAFGLLGVFLAPPLLAVLRNIYFKTYMPAMDRKVVPLRRSA